MSWDQQRQYVEEVHAVLAAATRWNSLFSAGISHALQEVEGCPHCEARRVLRAAVEKLNEVLTVHEETSPTERE